MSSRVLLYLTISLLLTVVTYAGSFSVSGKAGNAIAISADKRYQISSATPFQLQIKDARSGNVLLSRTVRNFHGDRSRISAVYTLPVRESFIVALTDIAEIWQISYADEPPPGFASWVHDYRVGSGENAKSGAFPIRVIHINNPLSDLFVDPQEVFLVGVSGHGKLQVIDLDLARVVADKIRASPRPSPALALQWRYQNGELLAMPDMLVGIVSLVDMDSWKIIKQINIPGPGEFLANDVKLSVARMRILSGPEKGIIVAIDKLSLELNLSY